MRCFLCPALCLVLGLLCAAPAAVPAAEPGASPFAKPVPQGGTAARCDPLSPSLPAPPPKGVEISAQCDLVCPPGAQEEGEPPCVDDYVDDYNSGCCCSGTWTPIEAVPGGSALMCGRSCTFLYNGNSYRDTDWFRANAAGTIAATCTAEFPVTLVLFPDVDCSDMQPMFATAEACEPAILTWTYEPGEEFWIWVGPSMFSGLPESDYLLEIDGLAELDPLGACCFGASCSMSSPQTCETNGGVWLGADIPCEPEPCGPSPGACCIGESCQVASGVQCAQMGGVWLGVETVCEPNPCAPSPASGETWGAIKRHFR